MAKQHVSCLKSQVLDWVFIPFLIVKIPMIDGSSILIPIFGCFESMFSIVFPFKRTTPISKNQADEGDFARLSIAELQGVPVPCVAWRMPELGAGGSWILKTFKNYMQRFPKMGVPQIINLNRIFHIQYFILRYPHCRKPAGYGFGLYSTNGKIGDGFLLLYEHYSSWGLDDPTESLRISLLIRDEKGIILHGFSWGWTLITDNKIIHSREKVWTSSYT